MTSSFALQFFLTCLSAVLYGLAFPPWRLWGLAWIALAPLLCALAGAGIGRAALLAWIWTMALSLTVISWFGSDVADYFGQGPWFGIVLFLVVPTITGAIDYMAFAAVWSFSYRRLGHVSPLLTGAAWVSAELGRSKLFFGNPWELAAYSQVDAGPLIQIADVTGIWGVSFLVAVVNGAVAGRFLEIRRDAPGRSRALHEAVLTVISVAIGMTLGGWRASAEHSSSDRANRAKVVTVQANLDVGMQWRRENYGQNFLENLQLTQIGLRANPGAVAFWPENAMTFFVESDAAYRRSIASVLTPLGGELVAGGARAMDPLRPEKEPFFNSAFSISEDGSISARYDKLDLLPFAERFPIFGNAEFAERFSRVPEFTPGEPTSPLPTKAGRAGLLICNEALFSEPARARVRDGAEYLAVLANDGWSEDSPYGTTALDMARVRAIEQRRWLVRTSTSGPSAIVDPAGRIVAGVESDTRGWAAAEIERRNQETPYARFGDWFAWLCVAATATSTLATARGRSGHVR